MSGALRRSFRAICRLAACWLLMQPLASAAEQIWEIQGEFVSLKAGDPTSVVLRTSSGGQIELPLAAFSANAQAVIRDLSQPGAAPLAVKGVAAPAADLPPALAEDLASCRTAADAADVCHLALANVEVVGDGRAAVETVLADLDARAARGESRLGGKWVGPDVMAEAAGKAAGHFAKSVEMIRLGNLKLAEQELRQASHADPASGRANFLLGLAFMMGTKPDFDEAARDFEEVVRREPDHGAAWNNLGICNVQKRRYPAAVTAFRSASTLLQDPQPVVGNLGLVIRMATDRRSRISENQLDEVSSLYHQLLQAGGVTAPEAITGPIVLLADGAPLAGGLGDLRSLIPPAGIPQAAGEVAGVVIAPGILACSVSPKLLAGDAGLTVALPDGRSVPAGVAGKSADGSIVLLKCEGLDAAPLPLLPTSPSAGDPVLIVVPSSATAA
ncbi:MAG: tetratricopeptide repeat protein, partial [Planctomycetota bacterium]